MKVIVMAIGIRADSLMISEFCKKHRVNKLSFFGSVLRDDFGPESDVDVLIEFEPGREPGMFQLVRMENELSGILGRKADIRTPEDLSRLFRDEVIAGAVVQYAA